MSTETEKTRSITATLRKYNEAREPWYEHIKATGSCYCGVELAEPIGKWAAEHSDCSVNLAPAPRNAAVALIQREDGRVLCVWNLRYGGFSFPGGMVEEGESSDDALRRELREETSCEVESAELLFEGEHHLRPKAGERGGRASVVSLYRVIARGEPREVEPGCRVKWLTWEEFLRQSPFGAFYGAILPDGPSLCSGDSRVRPDSLRQAAIVREKGLCGHVTPAEPSDLACILPIGHDNSVHEPHSKEPWNACIHYPNNEEKRRRCGCWDWPAQQSQDTPSDPRPVCPRCLVIKSAHVLECTCSCHNISGTPSKNNPSDEVVCLRMVLKDVSEQLDRMTAECRRLEAKQSGNPAPPPEDWADGVDAAAGVVRSEAVRRGRNGPVGLALEEVAKQLAALAEHYPGRAPRANYALVKEVIDAAIGYGFKPNTRVEHPDSNYGRLSLALQALIADSVTRDGKS